MSSAVASPPVDDMVTHALSYAARGWPVFPCDPASKRPFSKAWYGVPKDALGGFHLATCDAATITKWWARAPGAMIGVPTGRASGVFAIDPDVPKKEGDPDGFTAWRNLQATHGAAPHTHTHETPRGGLHVLFRWNEARPVSNSPGRLQGTGIDVRGEGGYIIAPPSRMADGRQYQFADPLDYFSFADAPVWLYELITAPEPKVKTEPAKSTEKVVRPDFSGKTFFTKVNRASLDRLDAWVTELFHGPNIKPGPERGECRRRISAGIWKRTSASTGQGSGISARSGRFPRLMS